MRLPNTTRVPSTAHSIAAGMASETSPFARRHERAFAPGTRFLFATLAALLLFVLPASAQYVTTSVAVGGNPNALAVNPVSNTIYVANESGGVTVINGATNATTTVTDPNATEPYAVAVDPVTNLVYVANYGSNNVSVVNSTGSILTTIYGPGAQGPSAIAVNAITGTVYVANQTSGNITVITESTNPPSVSATVSIGAGANPIAIAVNAISNEIYVANNGNSTVSVINGAGMPLAVNDTISVSSPPQAIAVNPVSNFVYVACPSAGNISVINGATNAATSISDPSANNPYNIAVNPFTNQVYVANSGSMNVSIFNGATNLSAASLANTVSAGNGPNAVAVDSVANIAYVADVTDGTVTVVFGDSLTSATPLAAGSTTQAIAVNPVTGKIYAANSTSSGTVQVLDGATNAFKSVTDSTGASYPVSVAVNPVTNLIYVADSGSSNVTVINGSNDTYQQTISDPNAMTPEAILVNPVTNQIYVANYNSNNLSVFDGNNNYNLVASLSTGGTNPRALGFNPVIDHIYVANYAGNNIAVIDGSTNSFINTVSSSNSGTTPIAVVANPATGQVYAAYQGGSTISIFDDFNNFSPSTATDPNAKKPVAMDVDAPTNTVFVANFASNNVTAIAGYTNNTTTITDPLATNPSAIAVNPITNLVYVANQGSNNVSVVDGSQLDVVTTIPVGISPNAIAVNPATNKIYVANGGSGETNLGSVTVIDGATNTATTVTDPAANDPYAVAVNPVTGGIFVPNNLSSTNTVINEQVVHSGDLQTTITALPGDQTTSPTPTFSFAATSSIASATPKALYFQVDTWQGAWTAATPGPGPGTFSGTTALLLPGFHILYAYATDGDQAATTFMAAQTNPLIGKMAAYGFLVDPPVAFTLDQSIPNLELVVGPTPEGVTSGTDFTVISNDGGATLNFAISFSGMYAADFAETSDSCTALSGALPPKSACTIDIDFTPSTPNDENAELIITDNTGGVPNSQQVVNLIGLTSASNPETLTVSLAGAGTGSVTDTSLQINCPSTCSSTYGQGAVVTLTATPSASSTFFGWNGACSGTGTCVVTMSSAESVTATFITTGTPATTNCTGSTVNWIGGASGNWSLASNWSGGVVPNSPSVNVCINDGASPASAVTVDQSFTVGNLFIDPGSSLTIADGQTLVLSGYVSNSGRIILSAAADNSTLQINHTVTLAGGGTVTLSKTAAGVATLENYGYGALTNVNNVIQGAGDIGGNSGGWSYTNGSAATVNASTGPITIDLPGAVTNQGVMEASGAGTLAISEAINNQSANIEALGSATVELLSGADIEGGTLTANAGATMETAGSATVRLDGGTSPVTIVGTYTAQDNSTTVVDGTLDNTGTIVLAAVADNVNLQFDHAVTLTGNGTVTLMKSGTGTPTLENYGYGALTNLNNLIQGAGDIGGTSGGWSYTNGSGATINANTGLITIDVPGTFVNQGVMEASGSGVLEDSITIDNQSANIKAAGSAATVEFTGNADIQGGTLTNNTGGTMVTLAGSTIRLDGSTYGTVTIVGNYTAQDNSTTIVDGTLNNTGTITLAPATNNANLQIDHAVTLTGGGTITFVKSSSGTPTLENYGYGALTNVNNVIQGTGDIGGTNGGWSYTNGPAGTVNANTGLITIDVPGTVVNQNVMEASGSGALAINVTIDNQSANIEALGSSTVEFTTGADIQGGTLTASAGATMETAPSDNIRLDGSTYGTLTIAGSYVAQDNSTTVVDGTINNTGTFVLSAGADNVNLQIDHGVTWTGGGAITLLKMGAGVPTLENYGYGALTNVNNLIQGAGDIGGTNSGWSYTNSPAATINANAGVISIDVPGTFINQGVLEATTGVLTVNETVDNAGGIIRAVGTGATVEFLTSADIEGGTLTNSGGTMATWATNTIRLDGSTYGAVTLVGNYTAQDNSTTILDGTINNTGNFTLAAGPDNVNVQIDHAVTLSGGGTITLTETGAGVPTLENYGYGALTNVNNLIQGTGNIGGNNSGWSYTNGTGAIINANSPGGVISINVPGTFTNQGVIESTGTGALSISTPVINYGVIVPANSPNAGTIPINSTLTQETSGALGAILGGTGAGAYSQINVSGAATLTGALNIGTLPGFTPSAGNQFTVLTASSISGTFSAVDSVAISGITWQVTYNTSSNPASVVVTAEAEPISGQTLSVTLLGAGTGSVTDDFDAIHCSEMSGATTGSCSGSYLTGTTVTLTATEGTDGSTFAGWGGACASAGTSPNCMVTMNGAEPVTANFVSAPTMVNLTFPVGTAPMQMATFDCPSNPNPTPANPCTEPNAHALQLTIPNVSTSFGVTVVATEVPPSEADGICETGNTVLNDFDCRFVQFFPGSTVASGVVVPLCYPYANGNCVHYLIYSTAGGPGTEPDPSDYTGPVYWQITWNNDTFTPPAPYWTGSTPRLYDDPDALPASDTTDAIGTNCNSPMTINGVPQSYDCQFEFDITTFFNPTKQVDSGIGGSTKQFNDVVVAFPPTTEIPANAAPAILSAPSTTMTVGTPAIFIVTTTGYPAPTLAVSGTLPSGVTLNTETGILSGTPAVGSGGVYPLMLTASNGVIPNATQSFTLTVDEPPTITSASSTTFNVGVNGTFDVTASGYPASTFTETGPLPSSVTLSTAGVLSGTPAAGTNGSYPIMITANNGIGSSAQNFILGVTAISNTYELSVTELGTGTGTVTSSPAGIDCTESTGQGMSGTCSASFTSGNVILTATPTSPSTFAGWSNACAGTPTDSSCTIDLTASVTATANFIPSATTMNITLPAGTNSSGIASFDCPGNSSVSASNPCTATQGPNAHALQLTVPSVTTSFTITVLATEVPPSMEDGLCEANSASSAAVTADFDCRFFSFFNFGANPAGSAIVPLCYPYANGNCVHYLVYSGTPGVEPPVADYSGGVYWVISWNNDTYTPTSYWAGSTPQLFDDPDYEVNSTAPYGTSCTSPMLINGSPTTNPAIYCQFDFNITTFYDPTKPVDSGIGGSTKQFNDVVVAFPPTNTGTNPIATPPTPLAPSISGACVTSNCTTASNAITFINTAGGAFLVTPTGYPAPTLSESGTLPSGLTFNSLTGILGGTPASGVTGSFPISFTATNSVSSATLNYTITIDQGPAITSAAATTFTVGSAGTFTVTATGFPKPTLSESGTLPGGVTFNTATGVLSGTPASGTGGTYAVSFGASNGIGSNAAQSFTLTVNQAPAITSAASATFTVGTAGTFTVTATGFPKPTLSESGTLPGGVTFNASTGVLAGTPTASGNFPITFTASNGVGSNATQSFTLTVNPSAASSLTFSPSSLNFGSVNSGNFVLRTLTITNTGKSMVTFTNFSIAGISGDDSTGYLGVALCPNTLNAGKSCVVIMSFTADSNVTKTHAANLLIADNATGSPQVIPMSATVINPQASVNPSSLNFGNQKTGTTSAAKSVALKNVGTTPLILSGLSISGNFAFAQGTTCTSSTSLAPGAACTMNVTFTPSSKHQMSGQITITDNAVNSPQDIPLAGTGD